MRMISFLTACSQADAQLPCPCPVAQGLWRPSRCSPGRPVRNEVASRGRAWLEAASQADPGTPALQVLPLPRQGSWVLDTKPAPRPTPLSLTCLPPLEDLCLWPLPPPRLHFPPDPTLFSSSHLTTSCPAHEGGGLSFPPAAGPQPLCTWLALAGLLLESGGHSREPSGCPHPCLGSWVCEKLPCPPRSPGLGLLCLGLCSRPSCIPSQGHRARVGQLPLNLSGLVPSME